MRIKRLTLCDFKGFYGYHEISFDSACKNLLIYGENGSGKTSLFQGLQVLLDSSRNSTLTFDEYRNRFAQDDFEAGHIPGPRGHVKIELDDGTPFTWAEDSSQTNTTATILADASKSKRFLDYKSLLRTYFLTPKGSAVDIFELLVEDILADTVSDVTGRSFIEDWQDLIASMPDRHTKPKLEKLNKKLSDFNLSLVTKLEALKGKTRELLARFDDSLEVDWHFQDVVYVRDLKSKQKRLEGHLWLTATFHNKPLTQHHQSLNEARLSAIAISIYLASLLLMPPSDLRLLALDDVLIGLDMSHRLPIIDTLTDYFGEHQIILLTYDQVWFNILKQRTSNSKWTYIELYCSPDAKVEVPVIVDDGLLARARGHLARNDHKATAVYLRSAFEYAVQRFCAKEKGTKKRIPVPYSLKPEKLNIEVFWRALLKWQTDTGIEVVDSQLQTDIELYRAITLNPLSHSEVQNIPRQEISKAAEVVGRLEEALK